MANVAKARLYNVDAPAVHDFYQIIEASTISYLVHVLLTFTSIQSASLAKLSDTNAMAERAIQGVDIAQDQQEFVEAHNNKLASWDLPNDLEFEECGVWHDSVSLLVRRAVSYVVTHCCLPPGGHAHLALDNGLSPEYQSTSDQPPIRSVPRD